MVPVKMTFVKFVEDFNHYKAALEDGSIIAVDPTVGCAIVIDIEEYNEEYKQIARELVGKTFIASNYCFANEVMLPSEGCFKEV